MGKPLSDQNQGLPMLKADNSDSSKIRIAISRCLLGESVRYDGTHKHQRYLTDTYGDHFEWVPLCPEHESGMGTPRESMRLEGSLEETRLITSRSKVDKTEQLLSYAIPRSEQLGRDNVCGIILKKGSPSCGVHGVKIFNEKGMPGQSGSGFFAREVMKRFPNLPIEEEGRLNDSMLRELFIGKVFTYHRYREEEAKGWTAKSLIKFHERHKYLLMAHDQLGLKELGQLLSDLKSRPLEGTVMIYFGKMMKLLSKFPDVSGHLNVLMHLMGYFKKDLTQDEKKELLEQFDLYKLKRVPLIVPITLLKHYVRKYQEPYLIDQVYLEPHPTELMIRNSC
jgi:uncharacterized protein YbgA (DUF1722 family)/uncharacterized protein YbbK (DUF523 family)